MRLVKTALLFAGLFGVVACGSNPQSEPDQPSPETDTAQAAPTSAGEPVPVPSDPKASYQLIHWSPMDNGHREAVTRRDGPSGVSYSRREIDCKAMKFRYLGEGDTLEQALQDSPNLGAMGRLIQGSISTEVSQFVCGR